MTVATSQGILTGQVIGACTALPMPAAPPTFSGPWARELAGAYRGACTQEERDILADGVISAEEMTELDSDYAGCLTNVGYTNVVVNLDGSMSMTLPVGVAAEDQATQESLLHSCYCATGWDDVSPLYSQIRGNPENSDIATIMAECLVRVGLKPAGYTAAQYAADFSSRWFESLQGSDLSKYQACNSDPAHAQ